MYVSSWIFFLFLLPVICSRNEDFNILGITAEGWEFVRDIFRDNFVKQRDLGASVAVYHRGQSVVDLWGGWFDRSQTKTYDNDTLQVVFSASKGLVAVAIALCVQRGLLNYSDLVTKYWPEYGQNGKEKTTVADILSHRAGLPLDNSPFENYLNWTAMIHILEKQEPLWSPGTAHGYHTVTYGWLAGELVRRVDPKKRTFGQFVLDEIANPLQIEFYIGLPRELEYRVSPVNVDLSDVEAFNEATWTHSDAFNNHRVHYAEIPAGNGITNARSVARLYASLIGDLDCGKRNRLLKKDILKQAIKSNTPTNETDFILQIPTKFAMGFLLYDNIIPLLRSDIFGHNGNVIAHEFMYFIRISFIVGWGGSIGLAVPAKQLAFSYVVNRLNTDEQTSFDPRYEYLLSRIVDKLSNNV